MAANAKELVLLRGYAVTGVTVATEQKIVTQGYASEASIFVDTRTRRAPRFTTRRIEP